MHLSDVILHQLLDAALLSLACVHDASGRRALERERQERRALHEAIFTKAPIGIAVTDIEGLVVETNPALQETLGYAADELHGMHFADLIRPEDRDADIVNHGKLLGGEIEHYAMEQRYLRKDGSVVRGNLRVSALGQGDGHPAYAVRMVEDVSQERSLQEQLFLSQRLEAVGQLAGGIAHDFNNYLTAISGYCQLAMMALPEGHEARADLREVLQAAESSASLTRQILAFSRRQVLERRPLDLDAQLGEIRKILGQLLGEDVEIEMDLAGDLWPVLVDAAQLEQALINLAINARDAMPRGGKLILRTTNTEVDELVASQRPGFAPGEYVLLTVADNGEGMSADVRDRAFEPFFTTKAPGHGTGLGLSTVYGIVKQHEGNIWVYSEPEAGTTFRIYLPRFTGLEEQPEAAVEEPDDPPAGSGRILVVEDDEQVREMVARSLETCGYDVISAASGPEALQIMESREPAVDLLLTDVVMPKMSGLDLADRVRQLRPGLRTLFMSGHSAEALARYRPVAAGLHWIHKPFTVDRLARKVQAALRDEA